MLSLSLRLLRVADLVERGVTLADVGCGHAKVCFYCLQRGLVPRAIGIDCSEQTLDAAREDAAHLGLDCEFRLGDGLLPLQKGEAQCAVIAGMGGNEIVDILSHAPYCVPTLVLVPHKNPDLVRKYLYCAGYEVVYDAVLSDAGHWYHVIKAQAGDQVGYATREQASSQTGTRWYVGKDNAKEPSFPLYRQERMARLQHILDGGGGSQEILDELDALRQWKGE